MKTSAKSVLIISFLLLVSINCVAQPLSSKEIDLLTERAMKSFDVPGIAVAVIKDGKFVHAKGYGVSSLNTGKKVDEHTLFGIASNSKAFTAAALAILVDEGKLDWNDRVVDYIPGFRLYNPFVTEEFNIKDLLTHRSGLGLGAGDLMIWPGGNDFTRAEVIHNLRYLKPVSSFRTKYDYDNLLYIVAGEIIAKVSGLSWEEFIEGRIMKPLGMNRSVASYSRLKETDNVIDAHVPIDGKLQVVDRDNIDVANAAGGIYSSIHDLGKWVILQLNRGNYGEGLKQQLFSSKASEEMWAPQTILRVGANNPYQTHFAAYALGWSIRDVKGFLEVSHTGGLTGMVSQVSLLPELGLGIIVLTNQQAGGAFRAITNQIKDSYLGIKGTDRVKEYTEASGLSVLKARKIVDEIWKNVEAQKDWLSENEILQFAGNYRDNWFGQVVLKLENGKLIFTSVRSPRLSGEMFFYKGNTFVVRWFERTFDADAFVNFSLDFEGRPITFKMKAISPLTDFSYDFHDLDFTRIE
jgi:CubicO group peptidase (beta-lactamase class C family)